MLAPEVIKEKEKKLAGPINGLPGEGKSGWRKGGQSGREF